jgi:hypothetical protein
MIRAVAASALIERSAFVAKSANGARIVADPARALVQASGASKRSTKCRATCRPRCA